MPSAYTDSHILQCGCKVVCLEEMSWQGNICKIMHHGVTMRKPDSLRKPNTLRVMILVTFQRFFDRCSVLSWVFTMRF